MNVDGIATQLEIDWGRIRVPEFDRGSSLQARFEAFHAANPDVYTALVRLSRTLVARGRTRIGIAMLFEVLRWNHAVQTVGDADFKLNNNFRSRYVRLIQRNEPDLARVFETRELKA